jgi:hypothetical protein
MVDVDLVSADKGTFRITADGRRVFDRAEQVGRRFPNPGEVAGLLQPDFGPPIAWRKEKSA